MMKMDFVHCIFKMFLRVSRVCHSECAVQKTNMKII